MSLVSELKRRNVFRMALLYMVAAWLIMQVAEVIIALANLPGWVGPAILGVLAIGFPITLAFSWFYELTPEGITLEKDISPGDSITHATGRRIDFIVISLLSAALILFAYDKWAVPEPTERSIAVLPFENMSPGIENVDFMATGIQDGLLTRLSRIGELKVISRTSVERYRRTTKNIREIAAELGVRKIVEGGVQHAGDQLRVNVQLIDAATDEHIWAATYDRSLTASNLFALQTEIVETIAQQLDANLTPRETQNLTTMPTQNLDAYTEYLRGMKNADIESVESLYAAVENFKAATVLDPKFALAYVGLADAYLTLGAYFYGGLPSDESTALAEPPLMHAFTLDGDLVEAQASLGFLRQLQGDEQAAEQAYKQAIALQPSYPRVFRLLGQLRWRQGRAGEAMELMQKALSLDPYSTTVNYDVGRLYDESGRFEEAMERYLRVIEIEPDHAFTYVYIAAIHYLVNGRVDESMIWYYKAAENDVLSPSLRAGQALAYLELGDPDNARIWVDQALELGPETFWALWASTLLNLYVGDDAAAQEDARTLLGLYPTNWAALRVLRDADILAGRYEVARSRYERVFRELIEPEVPEVDVWNYVAAIDLADVLMRVGETERANDLLKGSLKVIAAQPRMGVSGYWINDVRIYAIQQKPERALAALRQAIDEGWRLHVWYHLERDPSLDSIRGTAEFDELHAIVIADLDEQAQRVRELKASGELASVRGVNLSLE